MFQDNSKEISSELFGAIIDSDVSKKYLPNYKQDSLCKNIIDNHYNEWISFKAYTDQSNFSLGDIELHIRYIKSKYELNSSGDKYSFGKLEFGINYPSYGDNKIETVIQRFAFMNEVVSFVKSLSDQFSNKEIVILAETSEEKNKKIKSKETDILLNKVLNQCSRMRVNGNKLIIIDVGENYKNVTSGTHNISLALSNSWERKELEISVSCVKNESKNINQLHCYVVRTK